jgi:Family of unknown function (DUF6596)
MARSAGTRSARRITLACPLAAPRRAFAGDQAARTGPDGSIVPLAEQRREPWDAARIAEGQALLTGTLGTVPVGRYQLQAAIAAMHQWVPGLLHSPAHQNRAVTAPQPPWRLPRYWRRPL